MMNKTAIKNFAVWARNKLIADISYKAGLMGISEDGIKSALPQSTKDTKFYDIGTKEPYAISGEAVRQRGRLADLINQKAGSSDYKTAYRSVIEEVAYTWFNRLIAIRFMEVNDYLPSRIRALSSESGTKLEPDLVTTPFDAELELSDYEQAEIIRMKNENLVDDLFRMLFVKQCNALNSVLPKLFEKTADFTELLLNVSATDQDGVVYHLVHDIPENDFNISKIGEDGKPTGQVEIIGWLYQYYNTEQNELVYDGTYSKNKIQKELLPAATTIYTPDWAVRYMVENSLGRLWLEGHPNPDLKAGWKYYLDEAEQEADVQAQLDKIREEYKKIKPEDIKVIDPCMGSGHILVYAFDVLMQIYETAGYTQREAAKSILENNVYGLDIDDRAFQLAYFAVMMKARQYNRRILSSGTACHVYAIQGSNAVNRAHLKYFGSGLNDWERNDAMNQIAYLLDIFTDAKEYGSILNVEPRNWDLLRRFSAETNYDGQMSLDSIGLESTKEWLQLLIDIGQVMAQKYNVVVTNPPYLGSSRFSSKLDAYVKDDYAEEKADLSMVMLKRSMHGYSQKNGFISFITTSSWMFLSSFEKIRKYMLSNFCIDSLLDFGTELFDGKVGHNPITAWVNRNNLMDYRMTAIRLVDYCYSRRDEKEPEFFKNSNRYIAEQDNFSQIPGSPIAYWVSETMLRAFKKGKLLEKLADTRLGMATANNSRFVRCWYEVKNSTIGFGCGTREESVQSKRTWFPYNSGGEYRRWYGNFENVVNWENDGYSIRNYSKNGNGKVNSHNYNLDYIFKAGLTWSALSSSNFGIRYSPKGSLFDNAGSSLFSNADLLQYLLGFLSSKITFALLKATSPTMNFQPGNLSALPVIVDQQRKAEVNIVVEQSISLSRTDWDSFETSWDFTCHPLVHGVFRLSLENALAEKYIEASYMEWEKECTERFNTLKSNEEELNRIFIDIYGLQDELTPEVEDKDVTVRKADLGRDIRSLISYAVGCMFGRYSLDRPGLVFAGGDFNKVYWKYKGQAALDENGKPFEGGYAGMSLAKYHYPKFKDSDDWEKATPLTFEPDVDNVLPITDEEYFQDDIVGLFCAWLKKIYGSDTLEENLDFIAKALSNKGNTSREVIRNYFLNDFFKDHCKTYSVTGSGKRPIYWLFDSGKQNGFKALIYMHRYDENTIGNLRIDYLHRMERVYDSEIARMQDIIDNSSAAREVTAATKRKEKLQKQVKECKEYDEKIAHLALARIAIDLDDGVKVNYEKVQTGTDGKKYTVLAKI